VLVPAALMIPEEVTVASSPRDRAPAAMKWIDYATGTAAAGWAIASGYMPVRKSAVTGRPSPSSPPPTRA
jgi:ABC-type glycerol-3-phosphate transport system substrate-binding protein